MSMTPDTWSTLAKDRRRQYARTGVYGPMTLRVHGGKICLEQVVCGKESLEDNTYKTRLSGTYAHLDDFVFSVRSNTLIQKLATLIGMQDLEIGDPEFDSAFVVRANDAQKARELFADEVTRQLMLSVHRIWWLTIEARDFIDDDPNNLITVLGCRRAIVWERPGQETNEQLLMAMFEIFEHLLKRLCDLGMATPDGR